MRFRLVLGAVLLVVFLTACASPPSRDIETVSLLIDYINSATVDELVAQTKIPFLFDKEILLRESQVASMWDNLKSIDLRLDHTADDPMWLHEEDYGLVGDTLDLRQFFDRLSSDATMIWVGSNAGDVWLILSGNNADLALVRGIGRAE